MINKILLCVERCYVKITLVNLSVWNCIIATNTTYSTVSHFNQAILTLHFTFNILDIGWIRFVSFRLTAMHSIIGTTVRKPN